MVDSERMEDVPTSELQETPTLIHIGAVCTRR